MNSKVGKYGSNCELIRMIPPYQPLGPTFHFEVGSAPEFKNPEIKTRNVRKGYRNESLLSSWILNLYGPGRAGPGRDAASFTTEYDS